MGKALAVCCLIGCAFVSGCVSSPSAHSDRKHIDQSRVFAAAGIPHLVFRSETMLWGTNFLNLPRTEVMHLERNAIYFGGQELTFLYRTGDRFFFFANGNVFEIEQLEDKPEIQVTMSSVVAQRFYQTPAEANIFPAWKARFTDCGFTENRMGYVAETKFIDGSRSELGSADARVTTVELREKDVLWDGAVAELSVVEMTDSKLAVQLSARGASIWLYGSGSFQTNHANNGVKVSIVGETRVLTPVSPNRSAPEEYSRFYVRLKNMALARVSSGH